MLLHALMIILMSIVRIAHSSNPFCDMSSSHLLCIQDVGKSCAKHEILPVTSDEIISAILEKHNVARQNVAKGTVKVKGGSVLPEASNMLEMRWSEALATMAQAMGNRCLNEHSIKEDRKLKEGFDVGEIFARYSLSFPKVVNKFKWQFTYFDPIFLERKMFNADQIDKYVDNGPGSKTVNDFTQIIWAESYLIGCASSRWFDKTNEEDTPYTILLICHYGPAGNIIDNPIYKRGSPAKDCPSSAKYPGLCKSDDLETPEIPLLETTIATTKTVHTTKQSTSVTGGTTKENPLSSTNSPSETGGTTKESPLTSTDSPSDNGGTTKESPLTSTDSPPDNGGTTKESSLTPVSNTAINSSVETEIGDAAKGPALNYILIVVTTIIKFTF